MDCATGYKTMSALVGTYHIEAVFRSNSILNLVAEVSDKSHVAIASFLDAPCTSYSKEKKALYAKHKIGSTVRFSFFETVAEFVAKSMAESVKKSIGNKKSIAESTKETIKKSINTLIPNALRKENLHSDILCTILNPDTPEIGRKYFVEEFAKFLGIEDRFDCTKDFEVIREKWNRIDLLIQNGKQAIIIEDKINYARDMENQLVRYMKYVAEERGISTYTVVYLTLIDDTSKKPPLDGYDEDFSKYTDMLSNPEVLKEVYAVDGEKSLANDLLPKLCERLQEEQEQNPRAKESCDIARVYINQYKILLERLGGKAYMKSADKKLIEEIYSSQDKLDAANDFAEFWENRQEALRAVMEEKFYAKFPDKTMIPSEVNGYDVYVWSSNFEDARVYWDGEWQIGFVSQEGKKFSKVRQDELFEKLHGIQRKENEEKHEQWVYCDIKDTSQLFDDILNGLKILFEAE